MSRPAFCRWKVRYAAPAIYPFWNWVAKYLGWIPLFAEASRQGIEPQAVVGNYLLTASDETGRWDCHRAWVVGETPRDPADDR